MKSKLSDGYFKCNMPANFRNRHRARLRRNKFTLDFFRYRARQRSRVSVIFSRFTDKDYFGHSKIDDEICIVFCKKLLILHFKLDYWNRSIRFDSFVSSTRYDEKYIITVILKTIFWRVDSLKLWTWEQDTWRYENFLVKISRLKAKKLKV